MVCCVLYDNYIHHYIYMHISLLYTNPRSTIYYILYRCEKAPKGDREDK